MVTPNERIANVVIHATANRIVVHGSTDGVQAAHTRTRINASLVHARLIGGTFGANCALRTAMWRSA